MIAVGVMERAKQRRAILTGNQCHREADLQPGETLQIARTPAQPDRPEWYQAVITDAQGRRCALAWWHRPTSTLCDRLTVDG